MDQHIRIRVAQQADITRNGHPSQHQGATGNQAVGIVADTDFYLHDAFLCRV